MEIAEETRINSLRIRTRGGGIDPLSARLRMESLLSKITFLPTGLPASAIVCIRRLADPRPGTLRLSKKDTHPPRAWEEAVASSIEMLTRRAARPAFGFVPADAEAVLFLDRSELLACLARDWSEGSAIAQWWWKSLFRNPATVGTVMQAWLETPEYNPGALRILAEQGKAASFASKLSRNEAVALVRGMTQKFGLAHLQAVLDGQSIIKEKNEAEHKKTEARSSFSGAEITIDLTDENSVGANEVSVINTTRRSSSSRGWIPPPWHRFAPESTAPSLGPEHQALIGIGLMLNRAPAEIRKSGFAEAVSNWNNAVTTAGLSEQKPELKEQAGEINGASDTAPSDHSRLDPESGNVIEKPLDSRFRGNDDTFNQTAQRRGEPESQSVAPVAETDACFTTSIPSDESDVPSEKQPGAVATVQPHLQRELVIETELGGLFYFINLGLFLGLYGDFTTPRAPGIELDIWDFIALLGKRLMGEIAPGDPVWPLLATLAGRRETDTPGNGFEPSDEWRIPAAWLEAFPDKRAWRWHARASRLKVLHAAGFFVLDIPRTDEEPKDQLEREIGEYKPAAGYIRDERPVFPEGECQTALERWLDRLVPYVQARLFRALGHSTLEEISRVLCRRRARAQVTETHLDVHFDLAELPIEVRIAGLDRDPGWVPAAGRYITFHYE